MNADFRAYVKKVGDIYLVEFYIEGEYEYSLVYTTKRAANKAASKWERERCQ